MPLDSNSLSTDNVILERLLEKQNGIFQLKRLFIMVHSVPPAVSVVKVFLDGFKFALEKTVSQSLHWCFCEP